MKALTGRFGVTLSPVPVRRAARVVLPRVISVLVAAAACAHAGPAASANPESYTIEKPALRRSDSPPPRYPAALLATRDTGTVVLRMIVEPSGEVNAKSIEVVFSPHPAFTEAAIRAARESRFIPAEVGGSLPHDCRVVATGEERCQPGRPGTRVSQLVTLPIFFAPPPATIPP